jgi:hypothetical protein
MLHSFRLALLSFLKPRSDNTGIFVAVSRDLILNLLGNGKMTWNWRNHCYRTRLDTIYVEWIFMLDVCVTQEVVWFDLGLVVIILENLHEDLWSKLT